MWLCTVDAPHVEGRPVEMIAYGAEPGGHAFRLRCGDCGAHGGHHHPGCDVQRCLSVAHDDLRLPLRRGRPDDELDDDDSDGAGEPLMVNRDGVLIERRWVGEQEVIVHYDDIPASDRTTVSPGIPCTTASAR